MIYSIHIPKTAGTSFRKALEMRYGGKLALYYGPKDPKNTPILQDVDSRRLALQVPKLIDHGYEVLHGHYRFQSIAALVDDPAKQVWTWLRDPVERVLSQHDFFMERPLELEDIAEKVKSGEIDFDGFIRMKAVRNLQARYLAGCELSDLAFVGLTERFELGLAMLFGDDAPRLPMRYNAVSERRETSGADRAKIATLNGLDMQLYAEGLRLFLDRVVAASAIAVPERPGVEAKSLLQRLIERVA